MDDTSRIIYESGDGPVSAASPRRAGNRGRGPGIAVGVFALVVVILGGSGYALTRWLQTTSQEAAGAIPADVDLYVGIDAVRVLADDAQGLFETVARSLALAEGAPFDSRPVLEQMDEAMLEDAGFDFSNDIRPWLGRTAAVGIELGGVGGRMLAGDPRFVGAVEVRDTGGADAFAVKLAEAVEADGIPLEVAEFSGVTLYESESEGITFGRAADLFVFGTPGMVRRSLVLEKGQSLAEAPGFVELTGMLPPDRFLTGYASPEPPDPSAEDRYPGLFSPAAGLSWPEVTEVAFAASLPAGNAAFDVVSRLDGEAVEAATALDASFVDVLPADTLAFVQFGDAATIWDTVAAVLLGMTPDADALLSELNAEVGFDVVEELILLLDQPSGLAVVQSPSGVFAETEGVPLGGLVAFGTSQPTRVMASVDRLVAYGERSGVPIVREPSGVYSIEDAGDVMAIGVVDRWLGLGTSADVVEILRGDGPDRLTAAPAFRQAVSTLPGGQPVQAFVDIAGLVDLFADEPAVREAAAPYRTVAAGVSVEGDLAHATLVLTVDDGA